MNAVQKFVSTLNMNQVHEIIENHKQFEIDCVVSEDNPIRVQTKNMMRSLGHDKFDNIIMWMESLASGCYRRIAEQHMEKSKSHDILDKNANTVLANIRHAIRNHETVSMGGGKFSPHELEKFVAYVTGLHQQSVAPDLSDAAKNEAHKKLQVWWVPQIPMKPFEVEVNSIEEGVKIMSVLGDYDLFQYEKQIKPDYCNTGGLNQWDEDCDGKGTPGWVNWVDEETGEDDPRAFLNESHWLKSHDIGMQP